MSVPALRPLRVGEILDAAIKVYRSNARTLVGLTAVIVVPLQVLSGLVLLSTVTSASQVPRGFAIHTSPSTTADHATTLGATAVIDVGSLIVALLTTAACVKAVSDAYLGQQPAIGASLRFALRRALPLLGMDILYGLGLVLAFIALIVPGVWLYGAWSVATPALLVEGRSPVGALGRSRRLVRGRWWATAGVVLVATVMVAVISGIIEAILAAIALAGSDSTTLAVIVVSLAGAISAILVRPFQAAVITVLYYDLRVRHEGYDVVLLARQLGLEVPELPEDIGHPGPASVGTPGGPPFWPPPPGWRPASDPGLPEG